MASLEDKIRAQLQEELDVKLSMIHQLCLKYAEKAQAKAYAEAPWEDKTKWARSGLRGEAFFDNNIDISLDDKKTVSEIGPDGKKQSHAERLTSVGRDTIDGKGKIGFAIYHTMEYGKSLEHDHDGRYAILKPVMEALKPQFIKDVQEILDY